MKKRFRFILILLLFGLLILVRLFETHLFYDPLIAFFKNDYLHQKVPDVSLSKLLLHTSFRFFINSLISLLILWVAFKDNDVLKFSGILYIVAFLILLPCMAWLLVNATPQSNYNLLFYVRRFLIQPLFVLLLLPAFYYHNLRNN